MRMQPLCERSPAANELESLLPAFVPPPLVRVREPGMTVKEPANPPPDSRGDEREEEDPDREEKDLRHHRDQDADEAEDEEENREREVPRLVAANARFAVLRHFSRRAHSGLQ
jgi:hypothetical protein